MSRPSENPGIIWCIAINTTGNARQALIMKRRFMSSSSGSLPLQSSRLGSSAIRRKDNCRRYPSEPQDASGRYIQHGSQNPEAFSLFLPEIYPLHPYQKLLTLLSAEIIYFSFIEGSSNSILVFYDHLADGSVTSILLPLKKRSQNISDLETLCIPDCQGNAIS